MRYAKHIHRSTDRTAWTTRFGKTRRVPFAIVVIIFIITIIVVYYSLGYAIYNQGE